MTKTCDWVIMRLKVDGKWTKDLAWEFRCGPDTNMLDLLIKAADQFGDNRDQVVQDFMIEITKLRFPRAANNSWK